MGLSILKRPTPTNNNFHDFNALASGKLDLVAYEMLNGNSPLLIVWTVFRGLYFLREVSGGPPGLENLRIYR